MLYRTSVHGVGTVEDVESGCCFGSVGRRRPPGVHDSAPSREGFFRRGIRCCAFGARCEDAAGHGEMDGVDAGALARWVSACRARRAQSRGVVAAASCWKTPTRWNRLVRSWLRPARRQPHRMKASGTVMCRARSSVQPQRPRIRETWWRGLPSPESGVRSHARCSRKVGCA